MRLTADEHVAAAERLLYDGIDGQRDLPSRTIYVAAAEVHATLALVATLTPPTHDTLPEPHSTAWCNARDAWDTVESGRRFDDLDREMQAALATRWQARHG